MQVSAAAFVSLLNILSWLLCIRLPTLYSARQHFTSNYLTKFHMCHACHHPFTKIVEDTQYGPSSHGYRHEPLPETETECQKDGCTGKRYDGNGKPKIFHYFSPIKQLCNRAWWSGFRDQLEPFPSQAEVEERPDSQPDHHVHSAGICTVFRKLLYEKEIIMAGGLVLLLSLSADGFNPFSTGVYSITFIALRIMSYRKECGYQLERIVMVGLVPGPKKPPSLQPYLGILVSELDTLSRGVRSINPANSDEWVLIYAYLLLTIADYPGHAEIHGLEGHSSDNGCFRCKVHVTKSKGAKQKNCCRFRDLLDEKEDEALGPRTTARMPPPEERTKEDAELCLRQVSQTGKAVGGYKEVCALSSLWYYDFMKGIMFDFAHSGKGALKHVRNAFGGAVTNTEPKMPQQERLSASATEEEKQRVVQEFQKKTDKWEKKCRLRTAKLQELEAFSMDPKDLDQSDIRYKWAAGPGFADPSKTLFRRKGDLNIHECVDLLTSKLLLYCLYPFCPCIETYQALVCLIEVWTKIIDPSVPRKDLIAYKPVLNKNMGCWEKHAPFSCLGYFFHCVGHLLDMKIEVGCVQQYWMFFFERFVSYLNRICRSRVHPEANIANEMAVHMSVDDLMSSLEHKIQDASSPLTKQMLKSIDLLPEECEDTLPCSYSIPLQLRDYRRRLLEPGSCEKLVLDCKDHMNVELSAEFCNLVNSGSPVYYSPKKSWTIDSQSRNTATAEPAFGSLSTCIRKSGFLVKGQSKLVCQIRGFLVVAKSRLFVLAHVFQHEVHNESTLYRVKISDGHTAVIAAENIGSYVILCPWTERHTKTIDTDYLCALWRSRTFLDGVYDQHKETHNT